MQLGEHSGAAVEQMDAGALQLMDAVRVQGGAAVDLAELRGVDLHRVAGRSDRENRAQPDDLQAENIHDLAKRQSALSADPLAVHVNAVPAGILDPAAACTHGQHCMGSGNQALEIIDNVAALGGADLQLAGPFNVIFLESGQILIQLHDQDADANLPLLQQNEAADLEPGAGLEAGFADDCIL